MLYHQMWVIQGDVYEHYFTNGPRGAVWEGQTGSGACTQYDVWRYSAYGVC